MFQFALWRKKLLWAPFIRANLQLSTPWQVVNLASAPSPLSLQSSVLQSLLLILLMETKRAKTPACLMIPVEKHSLTSKKHYEIGFQKAYVTDLLEYSVYSLVVPVHWLPDNTVSGKWRRQSWNLNFMPVRKPYLIISMTTAMLLDKYHLGEKTWDSSVITQGNCEFQNQDFPVNLTFPEIKQNSLS